MHYISINISTKYWYLTRRYCLVYSTFEIRDPKIVYLFILKCLDVSAWLDVGTRLNVCTRSSKPLKMIPRENKKKTITNRFPLNDCASLGRDINLILSSKNSRDRAQWFSLNWMNMRATNQCITSNSANIVLIYTYHMRHALHAQVDAFVSIKFITHWCHHKCHFRISEQFYFSVCVCFLILHIFYWVTYICILFPVFDLVRTKKTKKKKR